VFFPESNHANSLSEGMKTEPLIYICIKIGIWTKEDPELELGPALDRREAIFENAAAGDVYECKAAYSVFGIMELMNLCDAHRCPRTVAEIYPAGAPVRFSKGSTAFI
jgi:hypothetical protein